MLNEFIGQFAIDLPKFLEASDKEKAETLIRIIGVGDQLERLQRQETDIYNKRRYMNQEADKLKKHADSMPMYSGVPNELVSLTDLLTQHQMINQRNAENAELRRKKDEIGLEVIHQQNVVDDLRERLNSASSLLEELHTKYAMACEQTVNLVDESTDEVDAAIENIEETNRKIRANMDRNTAKDHAEEYARNVDNLTVMLEETRKEKKELLNGAPLPLP